MKEKYLIEFFVSHLIKSIFMAKTAAFHSIKQNVYHDNTKCTEGNNIEKENLRSGTGGKPKCAHCARLN